MTGKECVLLTLNLIDLNNSFKKLLKDSSHNGKCYTPDHWMELLKSTNLLPSNIKNVQSFGWRLKCLSRAFPDSYIRLRNKGGNKERLVEIHL